MKYLVPILALLIVSCAPNYLAQKKMADQAIAKGDLELALKTYESNFKPDDKANLKAHEQCAVIAFKMGQLEKAEHYYTLSNYSTNYNADYIYTKALLYKQKGNISKELEALKSFHEKFEQDDRKHEAISRLYAIYFEIEDWEGVLKIWGLLQDEERQLKLNKEHYVSAQEKLKAYDNEDIALNLLKEENRNLVANRFLAHKYYKLANERYDREMAAYNKKKTRKQYKKLLKELKLSGKDYNKSAKYFKHVLLSGMDRRVVKYLISIYSRLNNKAMVKYYKAM